jgi:hypothetical protein
VFVWVGVGRGSGLAMQQLRGVDPMMYVRALGLLVRNPAIAVVPLLMGLAGVVLTLVIGLAANGPLGGLTVSLGQFAALLMSLFGFGAATIMGDQAWRRGRTSFDEGWADARRKAGDILMAAFGFTFVLYIAQYVGAIFGALGLLLIAAAVVFLIYTIPAAAIGGVPGGASLQVSIERARANPFPTIVVTIVSLVAYFILGLAFSPLFRLLAGQLGEDIFSTVLGSIVQAIAIAYIALVVGKTYTDVSLGSRY